MHSIPRSEHPRPQFVRENWMNLNGQWEFQFDFGNSGMARKLYLNKNFAHGQIGSITVPFCPESRLSGVGHTDFIPALWYRRSVLLTQEQLAGRVLLHFGAVDYHAAVWVNEQPAGEHRGGYTPFTLDITELVREGENTVTVYAEDDNRGGKQPYGKQCPRYESSACDYTRTTGIWQTVWLEFVPENYIRYARMTPMMEQSAVLVECETSGGTQLRAQAYYEGKLMGEAAATVCSGRASMILPLSQVHLWEVGDGKLYDLVLTLDGTDVLDSYFGMRVVEVKKDGLYLNGKPLFMRTVLDQGFYPDGIYTAPTDDDLRRDIELAMDLGFNGARFHQKIFEERSLYWADKLGYIVWGESAMLSPAPMELKQLHNFLPDWLEAIRRDYSHPCIIGWCPDNEVYWTEKLEPELQKMYYRITKTLDPTRPCIDSSGGPHFESDFYDVHDYSQSPEVLQQRLAALEDPDGVHNPIYSKHCQKSVYSGQPYWISECGGTVWAADRSDGWGYGSAPKSEEEFAQRYEGLISTMLANPRVCGFCYTQLTDIEQEQNGLYKYDRTRKFADAVYDRIRSANQGESAMEAR